MLGFEPMECQNHPEFPFYSTMRVSSVRNLARDLRFSTIILIT